MSTFMFQTVGGGGSSPSDPIFITYNFTDGQSATDLTGETEDGDEYTSVFYVFEIIRGTTVMANGNFVVQYLNVHRLLLLRYVPKHMVTHQSHSHSILLLDVSVRNHESRQISSLMCLPYKSLPKSGP